MIDRKEYKLQYGNAEQYEALLKVVKDGDTIIYSNVGPSCSSLTLIWTDALDRPVEHIPMTQWIRGEVDKTEKK